MSRLLVKDVRIVDADRELVGDILIGESTIQAVGAGLSVPPGVPVLLGEGRMALPAFVDLHAHFRDPGFPEKEDLLSGARAAAHGGFTCVSLMPNTDPACDSPEVARYMQEEARRQGLVEVYPVGAITRGLKGEELADMEGLAPYVWAFSDDGHGVDDHELMLAACRKAAALGRVVYPHPEFSGVSDPELSQELMVARDLWLCRRTGCRLHLAHLSTPGGLELVALAKGQGLPITCEVTPHHLTLSKEEACYTVNPPLPDRRAQKALVQGLREGIVDVIATDHAPHTPEDKARGAPGISGIELAFPILFTRLVKPGLIPLSRLSRSLSLEPARILGLNKGLVKEGFDGDLVLVEDEPFTASEDFFLSKNSNTPLLGAELRGRVWATIHKGEVIYLAGKVKGRDFDDHRQVI
ncbi:dihydroorotase [Candidatus Bipolaricaulota bacterium]|nr:dihydroorotase [Candidatus Bipolaricaulota bacterium]